MLTKKFIGKPFSLRLALSPSSGILVIGSIGTGSTFFFWKVSVCKLFILRIGWIEPAALFFFCLN